MDVSIILVNYNTYDLVVNCIRSIKEKVDTGLRYEIIVVDNCSPDRAIEQLTQLFPDVQLFQNPVNGGFGSGNNIGARHARGGFLLFLNTDTLLINDAVSVMYHFMENNPKVGVCGANLYAEDLSPATSFSQLPPSLRADFDYLFFNLFSKAYYKKSVNFNFGQEPLVVKGTVSGACYMMRQDIFSQLGGFDEDFFMYYEETELSYRVMRSGRWIVNNPEAKVIHLEGGSELVKARALDWTLASKAMFFKKTNRLWQLYPSNFVNYLTIIQRWLLFNLLGKKAKVAYWGTLLAWANGKVFNRK